MEVLSSNTIGSISAIAVVLAKGKLQFNHLGQAVIDIKLLLGQKSNLLLDNNKFSTTEIITAIALEKVALVINNSILVGREVRFDAEILPDNPQKLNILRITL